MIRIAYSVRDYPQEDLAKVQAEDIHYRLFTGDVRLRIGNADFSASWGWIPVVDFGVCLTTALEALVSAGVKERLVEFTESDEALRLHRFREAVEVSATYTDDRIVVPLSQLHAESRQSLANLLSHLTTKYPSLENNSYFSSLIEQFGPASKTPSG